jgi:hypothetical protein
MRNLVICTFDQIHIIKIFGPNRIRWVERLSRLGEMRNAYRIVLRTFEVKKYLGRAKRRQEDDIKLALNKYHRSFGSIFSTREYQSSAFHSRPKMSWVVERLSFL